MTMPFDPSTLAVAEGEAADAVAEAAARAVPYKLAEAYARRDLESILSFFAPGSDVLWIGTGSDEHRYGPEAIREQFRRNLEQSELLLFRFDAVKADSYGAVSWVAAEGSMQAKVAGRTLDLPVRFTAVLKPHGDEWLVAQAHLSLPAAGQVEGASFPTALEEMATLVSLERPDLGPPAPDGTVTILFTDIEDSARLTEELGDHAWMDVLRGHNELIRELVAVHGGYEVKARGDGFMLAFGSARRAIQCAIAIQREFHQPRAWLPDTELRVRIGLHTGETVRHSDDFFGKNVVLAARIAAGAAGGQIIASALVKALTESGGDIQFVNPHQAAIKGLAGLYELHEIDWRE